MSRHGHPAYAQRVHGGSHVVHPNDPGAMLQPDQGAGQAAGQPLINALFSEVNPIPVKEALAQMGMIEANYRMPLCPMADDTRAALTDALKGAGLLD